MIVGFTGTQKGMTEFQKDRTERLLLELAPRLVVHGGCIGADIDFDEICWRFRIPTIIRPSNIKEKQGKWYSPYKLYPERPPLERNKDIVNSIDILIAAPSSHVEKMRSGTWSTVRYARKKDKRVDIVCP